MANWQPRRITDPDEMKQGGSSDYMTLSESGQKFLGFPLFDGDVTKPEPGFYAYFEHWVQNGAKASSTPCAGPNCPYCEDGDRPKVRAKTLWLVTQDQDGDILDPPQVRIFNFNKKNIDLFAELRGEGEKIKGRSFRVSRLDDNGNYSFIPKKETITAGEIKEHLKDASDLEGMVTNMLRKAMEGMGLATGMAAAMRDDDDDEPQNGRASKSQATAAKKATTKVKKAPEPEEEPEAELEPWPAEAEDLAVVVLSNNETLLVVHNDDLDGDVEVYATDEVDISDVGDGEIIVISYVTDSDDDFVLTALEASTAEPEEEEAASDGSDLPDEVEDLVCEVLEIDTASETIQVRSDELDIEFTLFFMDSGPAKNVDLDDYAIGDKITVNAKKDSVGDLCATAVPDKVGAPVKKKAAPAKTTARKTATTTKKGR